MSADIRTPIEGFNVPVAEWFAEALGPPTRAQQLGWPAIQRVRATLLLAATWNARARSKASGTRSVAARWSAR